MISLLFCGDFVSQNPMSIDVDFKLRHLFEKQDVIAVNFEAPIRGFGSTMFKSGPSLTQSAQSVQFIEGLGANLILFANNHMMDMGRKGCEETFNAFTKAQKIGCGFVEEAHSVTITEIRGVKIGFVNVTHKEFGTHGIESAGNDYGTAWINHPKINSNIASAKDKCDVLVVLPHAGVEDILVPLPEWRARYKEFIDLGADVVIASHPHTPQGWECHKGGKIFYSLGNFFFQLFNSRHGPNWYRGLLVQLNIDEDKTITYNVFNTKFDDEHLWLDESGEFNQYNDYCNALLHNDITYSEYLDKELSALWSEYELYLLRGLAAVKPTTNMHVLAHSAYGIFKGPDEALLLNTFQCESHRWLVERVLKSKN